MPLPTMNTPSSRKGASAPTQRQVLLRIEPALQRQLHGGHVRLRISELQRHERAVVETALAIFSALEARAAEQLAHNDGPVRVRPAPAK